MTDINYHLFEFRENDLKVILDEIERGCYKTQTDVLYEVIRVFDEHFKKDLGANSCNKREMKNDIKT